MHFMPYFLDGFGEGKANEEERAGEAEPENAHPLFGGPRVCWMLLEI